MQSMDICSLVYLHSEKEASATFPCQWDVGGSVHGPNVGAILNVGSMLIDVGHVSLLMGHQTIQHGKKSQRCPGDSRSEGRHPQPIHSRVDINCDAFVVSLCDSSPKPRGPRLPVDVLRMNEMHEP
jgi:hypothetical protein